MLHGSGVPCTGRRVWLWLWFAFAAHTGCSQYHLRAPVGPQLGHRNDMDFGIYDWTEDNMTLIPDDALLGGYIEKWEAEEAGQKKKKKADNGAWVGGLHAA